jgi:hypothetical protein
MSAFPLASFILLFFKNTNVALREYGEGRSVRQPSGITSARKDTLMIKHKYNSGEYMYLHIFDLSELSLGSAPDTLSS